MLHVLSVLACRALPGRTRAPNQQYIVRSCDFLFCRNPQWFGEYFTALLPAAVSSQRVCALLAPLHRLLLGSAHGRSAMAAAHAAGAAGGGAAGAAPAAGAAGHAIAAALAGIGAGDDPAARRLADLQQQDRDLKAAKRANTHAIKNEQRKTQRLKERAKTLSTEDLQDILIQRAAAAAKAKAKPKAKAKAAVVPAAAAAAAPADDE